MPSTNLAKPVWRVCNPCAVSFSTTRFGMLHEVLLAEFIATTISADGLDGDNGRSAARTPSRRCDAV